MRKLIESTLVSLDGVIESPDRWAPFDEESVALAMAQLDDYDAFVMRRVTYERLSQTGPTSSATPTSTASTPCPSTWRRARCATRAGTPRCWGPTPRVRSLG
jgi:hypothetical protein